MDGLFSPPHPLCRTVIGYIGAAVGGPVPFDPVIPMEKHCLLRRGPDDATSPKGGHRGISRGSSSRNVVFRLARGDDGGRAGEGHAEQMSRMTEMALGPGESLLEQPRG